MFEQKIEQYLSIIIATGYYLANTELTQTQHTHLEKIIRHTEQLRDEYTEKLRLPSLQFASYLNHDARTPLSVIIGYSELLQEGLFGAVTDVQVNGFSQILDSAYGITDLINDWVKHIRTDHSLPSVV